MAENYHTCCNKLHVKQATWGIAFVHLAVVGFFVVWGILSFLGIVDTSVEHQSGKHGATDFLTFGGLLDNGGVMIGAIIWLIFVLLLMYGLHNNKSAFILAHLIASIVFVVIIVARLVTAIIDDNRQLDTIITHALFAALLIFLLWIEYRCFNFVRHSHGLLPH